MALRSPAGEKIAPALSRQVQRVIGLEDILRLWLQPREVAIRQTLEEQVGNRGGVTVGSGAEVGRAASPPWASQRSIWSATAKRRPILASSCNVMAAATSCGAHFIAT